MLININHYSKHVWPVININAGFSVTASEENLTQGEDTPKATNWRGAFLWETIRIHTGGYRWVPDDRFTHTIKYWEKVSQIEYKHSWFHKGYLEPRSKFSVSSVPVVPKMWDTFKLFAVSLSNQPFDGDFFGTFWHWKPPMWVTPLQGTPTDSRLNANKIMGGVLWVRFHMSFFPMSH